VRREQERSAALDEQGADSDSRFDAAFHAADAATSVADIFPAAALVIAGIAVVLALVFLFWEVALFGIAAVIVEGFLLVVAALGTLLWLTVRRRPWTIAAVRGSQRYEWLVRGFRSSARARDEIARRLTSGQTPTEISSMELDLWLAAQP
jgi:hypothetical protein